MKKFLVPVALILLSVGTSTTQWQRVTQLPERDISSLNLVDGTLYAGVDSLIYISSDGGNSWRTSGYLSGSATWVLAVTRFNGRLFVGTAIGGVFTSTNDGASWQQINTGLNGLGATSVSAFVRQGTRLIAGTEGAGTYILQPNMQSWSPFGNLPLNISGTVYAMTSVGDTAFAGAGANGTLYRLTPGSSQWEEIQFSGGRLVPASAFTRMDGDLFTATTNGIYRSTNHGRDWSFAGEGVLNGFSPAICGVRDTLFTTINRLPGITLMYRSTNKGAMWELESFLGQGFTYAMVAVSGKIFLAREQGLWYRETETTSVDEGKAVPVSFVLHQNFPNPFNPSTTIGFQLVRDGRVSLKVFNLLGEEIAGLIDEELPAGMYAVPFDAKNLASGTYFYRMQAGGEIQTRKLTLLK